MSGRCTRTKRPGHPGGRAGGAARSRARRRGGAHVAPDTRPHGPAAAPARERDRGAQPPTFRGRRGLPRRTEGRGRPGGAGREGRRQGRGPDVRHRSDAACVRDSEYVTEPRTLMPAAPPRPSPGPRRHGPGSAWSPGRGRERRASGQGPAPTPTEPRGSRDSPPPLLSASRGRRSPLPAAAVAAVPPLPGRRGPE